VSPYPRDTTKLQSGPARYVSGGDPLRDDGQEHQDKKSVPLFYRQHLEGGGMNCSFSGNCIAALPAMGALAMLVFGVVSHLVAC